MAISFEKSAKEIRQEGKRIKVNLVEVEHLDIQHKGGDKKSSSQEVFAIANGIYNLRQDRMADKEKRCQKGDGRISYHTLNKEK